MDAACFERFTGRPPRPGQCAVTCQMVDSVKNGKNVVLEAPTGTGKTLIAIAGGFQFLEEGVAKKILLVAHTKLLQKQHECELKRCCELHPEMSKEDVAVLYGKSNYICRSKVSMVKQKQTNNPRYLDGLMKSVETFSVLNDGNLPTFDDLSPPPPREEWNHIACGGNHAVCKKKKRTCCEHTNALSKARAAKIVVVNQTLLWCISQFAKFPVPKKPRWQNRSGEVVDSPCEIEDWRDYIRLQGKDTVVIIDEAHELQSLVSDRKTWTVSIDHIMYKLSTFVSEAFKDEAPIRMRWERGPQKSVEEACDLLTKHCQSASKLHYNASEYHQIFNVCHLAWQPHTKTMIKDYVSTVVEAVNTLLDNEGPYKKGIILYIRNKLKKEEENDDAETLHLQQMNDVPQSVIEDKLRNKYFHIDKLTKIESTVDMLVEEYTKECNRDDTNIPVADAISITCDDGTFEKNNGKRNTLPCISIRGQPLTVSNFLKDSMWSNDLWGCKAYVCMSATITIGRKFESFLHRNGLSGTIDVDCLSAPCVFDYETQMEIQVSPHQARSQNTLSELIQFITNSKAACLLLFTSNYRLHEVCKQLDRQFKNERVVMEAGEDVEEALQLMINNPKSVVCGCKRYWTGVDVPNLGLVYIDAMPYSSDFWPRKSLMGQCGGTMQRLFQAHYEERMLQQAIQGIGRLIRAPSSKGKVYIADVKAAKFSSVLRHAFPKVSIKYVGKHLASSTNTDNHTRKKIKR